MMIVLQL